MISQFFSPKSIAVIGASEDPKKIGSQIFAKLQSSGKKIYPINPKFKYSSILAVPDNIDQAIIAIPSVYVNQVVGECLKKKVNSIVIITAGFSEIGPEGAVLETKLKTQLKNYPVVVLGPNCLGYANPLEKLDITFAKASPPPGNIALITQSGAIGSFLFDWAQAEKLGFSKFVSLGNRVGLNENQLLPFLAEDPKTKVIALYLESFADPIDFLKVASRASKLKPIIVLFGGQTASGKKAAASHTAALSPDFTLVKTLLDQAGCLEANSLQELTDLLELFSLEPPLIDNDLAIITNAGGPGILATDTASQHHFKVDKPFDVYGDANAQTFADAFKQVIKDKIKDAFLIIITVQTSTEIEATCQIIINQFKSIKKPIVVSLLAGNLTQKAEALLQANKIATIKFPQSAVKYLAKLYHYWRFNRQVPNYPIRLLTKPKKPLILIPGIQSWQTVSKIARLYHLPLVLTKTINLTNLSSVIKALGFPLVLKSDPSAGFHRTDNKALFLNLKSFSAVKKAYRQLSLNFSPVLAQPQIQSGHELFLGWQRRPNWPILFTLGSGGIYTEIYQDIARSFLPLNRKIILNLLNQTKIGQILNGVRGQAKINLRPLINLILNISQCILDQQSIEAIDINPVIINASGLVIIDIKIISR